MKKLSKMIIKAKREGTYAEDKLLNPREERPQIGPFSVMTYFNGTSLDLTKVSYNRLEVRKEKDNSIVKKYTVEEISDVARVEALTRMWRLESAKFLGAKLYWGKGLEGKVGYIDVQFEKGIASPILFPSTESNVGIYKNLEGELSFVSAGRLVDDYYIDPKPFFGTKAKFDISANQAVKNFKLATPTNKGKKVFVALAEIQSDSDIIPVNAHGNAISTKPALDVYISKITREKTDECKISHPAHKIFTKINGEIVRVKGAAHCMDIIGVVEGNTEDKIVILAPSEVTPKGKLVEDLDKFQFLVNFGEELKEVVLTVNHPDGSVQEIETVGMYIEIYEDAYHSAVYSLKVKEQNIFYYGGITALYQKNGWDKLAQEISRSLDHVKLGNVLNVAGKAKSAMKKIKLEDIK